MRMKRFAQAWFIVSTLTLSWLLMMVVHEFGHVLHAWLSGGRVSTVVLHPLAFSRTDLADNPHPHFVCWGGAVWGCGLPLLLLLFVRMWRRDFAYLASFFAGFCLIANGAYLAAGSFPRAGDAGDLMHGGSPQWLLILVGVPAAAGGLWLWNGLGPHFGLGRSGGRVDGRAAIWVTAGLATTVFLELFMK
jgi:hypothetical protein